MAPESNKELVARLRTYVDRARESATQRHSDWKRYWDWYTGQHATHLGLDLEDWQSQDWTNANRVYAMIEQEAAILGSGVPIWYVVPPDPRREEHAARLTDYLQGVWHQRRVATELHLTRLDVLVCGIGAIKCWFDRDLGEITYEEDNRGRWQRRRSGDVNVQWLDPYSFFPDPTARRLKECEYVAIANDLTRGAAERTFDRFDAESVAEAPETVEPASTADSVRPAFFQRFGKWFGRAAPEEGEPNQLYRIYEVYSEAGQRLTYFSGEQFLWDGPNPMPEGPYKEHRYPVHIFTAHPTGHSLIGQGEVEQLEMLQRLYDLVLNRMAWQQRFTGNPVVVTDQNVPESNAPGQRVRIRKDGYYERKPGVPLNESDFALLQTVKQLMQDQTGVHEAAEGRRPPSLQSGIAIQHLQEASQARIGELNRLMNEVLEEVGQSILNLMAENYEQPMTSTFMRNGAPVVTTIAPDMLREQVGTDEGGLPVAAPLGFRCLVQDSGDLPLNPMARAQLASQVIPQMAKLDPIHAAALAEAVNIPGWMRILQQRADWQEFMAWKMMMQQQAATAGGAAAGSPPLPGGRPGFPMGLVGPEEA